MPSCPRCLKFQQHRYRLGGSPLRSRRTLELPTRRVEERPQIQPQTMARNQTKRKRQRQKRRGGKRNLHRRSRETNSKQQTIITDDKTVVNLSKLDLEEEDIKNLSLGLSYCQPNHFEYEQSRIDLFLFIRKLKLLKIHTLKNNKTGEDEKASTPNKDITMKLPSDNLLIEDATLLKELWEMDENISITDDEQVIARLDLEGITTDKTEISGLKQRSKTVPGFSGDLIDQFSETIIKGLKTLKKREMEKTRKIKTKENKMANKKLTKAATPKRVFPFVPINPDES
ncbi:hypothetical protein NDU88_007191 [Pleurodeles waltl]|uniref:Uncharacterized protein n=1 Tax=Pleurodeles waltl TaxID=8319 RepID=A0AAV7TZ98_PLEWA|nr:hypothetical protein NDU88_007191 [Pleurodeles waltl]